LASSLFDQAANRFSGYGQGAQGYAKRYGASYGNFASGLFIGGAVLPSILKQDPRYFYKGTGTKRSRFLYAISRTVVCKGDNQLWQPNYSSVLGVNSGSQTIPQSSATWLPAAFRICTFRKETATGPH
jgi:hypothetical protein